MRGSALLHLGCGNQIRMGGSTTKPNTFLTHPAVIAHSDLTLPSHHLAVAAVAYGILYTFFTAA